jgi:hypothetical protein
MDDFEDLKIKAEIDEIARKIDTIMNRVETEDPGRPPSLETDADAGTVN